MHRLSKSIVLVVIAYLVGASCTDVGIKQPTITQAGQPEQIHGMGAATVTPAEYQQILQTYGEPKVKNTVPGDNAIASQTNGYTMLITPPVLSQGATASCVGWAVGYTAMGILTFPKYNCWGLASRSPNYIYDQLTPTGTCYYPSCDYSCGNGKPCVVGCCQYGCPNYETCESGCANAVPPPVQVCAYCAQLLEGVQKATSNGDCSLQKMPFDQTSCSGTGFTPTQSSDALANKAAGYSPITTTDVTSIKAKLDAGLPVVVTTTVDNGFNNLGSSGIWTPPATKDPNGSKHATCLVGYDDSQQMFKGQNQWGTTWGQGGFYWVSYTAVANGCLNEAYYLTGNASVSPLLPMYISGTPGICQPSTSSQYSIANLPPNASVSWSIDNTSVATITSGGMLNYVANGSATITATVSICEGDVPMTFKKTIYNGPAITGTSSVNGGTPAALSNGSNTQVQVARSSNVSVAFHVTSTYYTTLKWTYDNVTGYGSSFNAGFTAPATGYSYLYKTVTLDATGPCGTSHNVYNFSIMSMGW